MCTYAGLISIEVQGNEVVVKGDGVDCITLTSALRKKLGWACIVSVEGEEQNKPAPASTEPEAQAPSTPLAARSIISPIPCYVPYYTPCSPYPEFYVCERLSPDPCSIL